jgi:hypothetical protein
MIKVITAVCEECYYPRAILLVIDGWVTGDPLCPFCHMNRYTNTMDKYWKKKRGRRSKDQNSD